MPDNKRFAAYIALVGGGIGGFIMNKEKKIAVIGFALYTIHGVLGLAEILTRNYTFERNNRDYTVVIAGALCQGLITTEYCKMSGLELKKAFLLNMIPPVLYLAVVYILENSDLYFIGDIAHIISCCAMAYYGYQKDQYMAYVVSIMYLIVHFARMGWYETCIAAGITAFSAGMLLAGKEFLSMLGIK